MRKFYSGHTEGKEGTLRRDFHAVIMLKLLKNHNILILTCSSAIFVIFMHLNKDQD